MKTSFEDTLARHVPPGVDGKRELIWLAVGGALCLLYSLSFFIVYLDHYQALFVWDGTARILNTEAVMPDFIALLGNSLTGFLILALCLPALIFYHYAYHYRDSMSIYLMKRLPDRWELHRRCISLPFCGILACCGAAFILLLVYFGVYMLLTPSACLAPDQWQKIWIAFLGVVK